MKPIAISLTAAVLASAFAVRTGPAQDSASQRFVVHVPPRVVLRAPADAAIVHDGVSAEQSFPPQAWDVSANAPAGVTVTFRTDDAFRSQGDAARDARLSLAIRAAEGGAAWSVGVPEARTDLERGETQAVVQASSNAAGVAKLDLAVTFLGGAREQLPDGDYALTVTATVTSHE